MKSQETKKGNTLLKSIITLIVTLLLGTTAWSGIQEDASNDSNYNLNTNQTISTESNNNLTDDIANNIQNNTSENSLNNNQITSENSNFNDNEATSENSNSNDNEVTLENNSSNDNETTSDNNSSNDNQIISEDSNKDNETVITENTQTNTTAKEEKEDKKEEEEITFTFRSKKLLDSHYEKHGKEMGFASAKEYEQAASKVVTNKEALHKIEAEDGDDVYYIESTNEFVVVSKDGYLRTYFYPSAGLDYFNRQ